MGLKGLIKETSACNRIQQRKDWRAIKQAIGKEVPDPDWTKSVKKIDAYMEAICKANGLNHLDFFGKGK